jgi:hypothetical protein
MCFGHRSTAAVQDRAATAPMFVTPTLFNRDVDTGFRFSEGCVSNQAAWPSFRRDVRPRHSRHLAATICLCQRHVRATPMTPAGSRDRERLVEYLDRTNDSRWGRVVQRVADLEYRMHDRLRPRDAFDACRDPRITYDLGVLSGRDTCLLVTYRKSGEPVPSPVLSGTADGKIYVRGEGTPPSFDA